MSKNKIAFYKNHSFIMNAIIVISTVIIGISGLVILAASRANDPFPEDSYLGINFGLLTAVSVVVMVANFVMFWYRLIKIQGIVISFSAYLLLSIIILTYQYAQTEQQWILIVPFVVVLLISFFLLVVAYKFDAKISSWTRKNKKATNFIDPIEEMENPVFPEVSQTTQLQEIADLQIEEVQKNQAEILDTSKRKKAKSKNRRK
ncbi:hypothetical protein [Mycoplasmopsis agassizii]|uniref:Uncharacterized protein n=1 Tax=Mycoplasmopsis agassizii TaxID=33922 RepID=A0ABX4H4I9_9BACT|nr:hypothetical protein [Mycoplasmopsis agassizii]PAF54811.1 hypothetical protein CJF60_03685 [Mycoplasmopsis agassizii]SMC19299.1 hypothetical protein SAMN02745179_00879 [Mycoplasmopsis agassizii]